MFNIRLLPESILGQQGQRLGEITIGDFTERFACQAVEDSVEQLEKSWHRELRRLIGGETPVALIHDPRFAWIFYRVGPLCFIQQRLSLEGAFSDIPPRETHTDEGDLISEWGTTLAEIERFLEV